MSEDERFQYMLDDAIAEIQHLRAADKEIFLRLNELEKRMAQVVIIAAALAFIIPVLIESVLKN